MTTTKNLTEVEVLAHHGVTAAGGQNLTDQARAAGVLSVCLGCGSVVVCSDMVSRARYAATLDLECCPDATSLLY